MPGEPPQPLTSARPAWVGIAGRLAPDPGQDWLRSGDAAHARMLRHLGARALHEPLLAALPTDVRSLPGMPTEALDVERVVTAGRALRALLPGQPKPVAALTRSPEVTAPLLELLSTSEGAPAAREQLAAQVLFSLGLSRALHEPVTVVGPLVLEHGVTRRQLELAAGARLQLGPAGLLLDARTLDPWGPELSTGLVEHHGFALPRRHVSALAALGQALERVAAWDGHPDAMRETFTALELAPHDNPQDNPEGNPRPHAAALQGLPLAIGRARLPADADADTLAAALVRESALHKLTLLRLVDPLVHDDAALPQLLRGVASWAARRLGLRVDADSWACRPEALTALGQRVQAELQA